VHRKKLLITVILIVVVGSLIAGCLVAYFTDTETSNNNRLAQANFDLKLDGHNDPDVPVYIDVSNVVPGSNNIDNPVIVHAENAGAIDGVLSVMVKDVVNDPGVTPPSEPDPDNGELSGSALLTIEREGVAVVSGTIDALNGSSISAGNLAAGQIADVKIVYEVPAEVGNEIIGDSVTFSIEFRLDQN